MTELKCAQSVKFQMDNVHLAGKFISSHVRFNLIIQCHIVNSYISLLTSSGHTPELV